MKHTTVFDDNKRRREASALQEIENSRYGLLRTSYGNSSSGVWTAVIPRKAALSQPPAPPVF